MIATGFTPHDNQRKIIQSILEDDTKLHIVSVGRQFGKSLMGINLVLYWAINNSPCKILWVSPVYSQTNKVQKELDNAIRDSMFIESCNYSDSYIKLRNGSEIYFRSAERYDNIRGFTFDYAVLDEAAFMKEEAWSEAIRPTLAVKGKKALFLSTPKGKNWFYKLYNMGISPDYKNIKAYKGSSYDTPYISDEEINDARKQLAPNIFKQEYLAEFLDGGGSVFSNIKSNTFNAYPNPTGTIYCGIDLGRADDWTVATFMDSNGNVIHIYRANNRPWNEMTNEIASLINKYKAIGAIEVNSMGDVIYEQLKAKVTTLYPFQTTNKSKQEIIEGLILDFNESNIKIPSETLFNALAHELEVFTYDYNPKTRSIKYGAPSPLHDDCVMSLAITNWCRKTQSRKGKYSYYKP